MQDTAQTAGAAADSTTPLMLAGSVLLLIVLMGLPVLATRVVPKGEVPLKGLGLPAGSVRDERHSGRNTSAR